MRGRGLDWLEKIDEAEARAQRGQRLARACRRLAIAAAAVIVLLAIVGALAGATGQTAETPTCPRCGAREALETCFAEKFGEQRSAAGQDVRGPIVFLFVNRGTGSWTIIATMDPAGAAACVIAGGAGWRIDAGF